ncbi:hypothetical protein FQZ97_1172830 [compost metagenome]
MVNVNLITEQNLSRYVGIGIEILVSIAPELLIKFIPYYIVSGGILNSKFAL